MLKLEIGMRGKACGFTLIEILIVIVIISVTLGFAMMAFGDFGESRKIRTAAEGFSQFLEFVHERALLESSTLKVQLTASGYDVLRLGPDKDWQKIQSSFYHHHPLPPQTVISVDHGGPKHDRLTVIMSGAGDMTAFKVYFGTAKHPKLASIIGEDNGTIVYQKESTP